MKFSYAVSITLLFILSSNESFGKTQEFKNSEDQFTIDAPEKWDTTTEHLGIPFALVSKPGSEGNRSVIAVVPIGMKDEKNGLKKIKKDTEEYVRQKEEWLANVGGESLSYDTYKEESLNGNNYYSIGITYETLNGIFHEKTYYVSMKNKKIYFIKTMVPEDLENEHASVVSNAVRSIASLK